MKVGKKLVVILAGVVALASVAFSGCKIVEDWPEFENDYYKYIIKTTDNGEKEAYLTGFTELGMNQKYLIYPKSFDGIRLCGVGYKYLSSSMMGAQNVYVGNIESSNLEKMFIPHKINGLWSEYVVDETYNLHNCKFVVWNVCQVTFGGSQFVFSYNLVKNGKFFPTIGNNYNFLANVSYMYNYEGAENEGYYWADSYDQTTIDFIPPEPEREGYTFGGWYKEPECINKWDFETDKVGQELRVNVKVELIDNKPKEITWLYARWVKE